MAAARVFSHLASSVARLIEGLGAAVLLSLLLHGLLFSLFFINWKSPPNPTVFQPKSIQASLVELPSKAAPRQLPATKPRPQPARSALSNNRASSAPAKPAPKATAKPAAPVERNSGQSAARRELMANSKTERPPAPPTQAQTGDEMAASYVAAIAARLTEQWSRPPSARLGMTATLRINTVPTGRVVAISVIHSSGSEPFDRSVELAVERVGQFEMIAELYERDPALYERQFRQLDILFSPEDLRL